MSAPLLAGWPARGLTCLAGAAECGQGQQGEEHAGLHGVSGWRWVCCSDGAVSASRQHPLYSGPCPGGQGGPPDHGAGGSQGTLPGLFGVIRPRSIGQTPKDVVVGTRAAWAGLWEWRRRVGGNLRLPASGCPRPSLRDHTGPPVLTLLETQPPSEQARRGTERGPEVQNGLDRTGLQLSKIVISTVSRGQEPNPREGVPGDGLIHPETPRQAWCGGGLTLVRPGGSGQEKWSGSTGPRARHRWGWA